tara:strand:+ start:1930 stop:2562 length:633 start_codon:yes stop_codon:yes gene_type:complete
MSDDKKLKRKQKKFFKTADQISKNQKKRDEGKDVNQNQQDRKFKKLNKTAEQLSQLKKEKDNSSNNYGTMKTPNNMGAPNFYVMDPGSPAKKMDTPGGFSYKASTVLNKLGFVDSGMNDGHSPMPFDNTKKKKSTESDNVTELDNVNVKAPKNITITEGFYRDASGRPSKTTKEGHKIITKVDPNKYTLIDGKRKKGKIISQSLPVYDRS